MGPAPEFGYDLRDLVFSFLCLLALLLRIGSLDLLDSAFGGFVSGLRSRVMPHMGLPVGTFDLAFLFLFFLSESARERSTAFGVGIPLQPEGQAEDMRRLRLGHIAP